MYSRGIVPPVILSWNSKPLPGFGSDLQLDVAVLAVAARLTDEASGAMRPL